MSKSILSSFGTIEAESDTPVFVFPKIKTTSGEGTISSYDGLSITVPATAFCTFIYIGTDASLVVFGDSVEVEGYNNSPYKARLTSTQLRVTGLSYSSIKAAYYVLSLS